MNEEGKQIKRRYITKYESNENCRKIKNAGKKEKFSFLQTNFSGKSAEKEERKEELTNEELPKIPKS